MRRFLSVSALAVGLALVPGEAPAVWTLTDRIWFAPAPGSLDMLRLFEHPEEWPRARATIDVFKFYHQHATATPPSIVGPNSLDALARADAFRQLARWGKRIALEAGSVKEFYCTDDASGMRESSAATIASLAAIRAAGGAVSYLAMDEPFFAGESERCGGPSLARTADRILEYVTAVRAAFPGVRIGLIEPYPSFAPADFAEMLRLLRARGFVPWFLHVDIYLPGMRPDRDAFGRDVIALADIAARERVLFGIIVWGENGDADSLYAADAMRLADEIGRTFRSWSVMPPQIVFQSWAESRTGLRMTPRNLPETAEHTHTRLLNDIYAFFRQPHHVPR